MQNEIVTFGCRLNAYESEVMRAHAVRAGMENAIIFNTCAVTKEAERQARQAIRKARRRNPDARIVVTGCSAQIHPDSYADMEEVDLVLGNEEKMWAQNWERVQKGAQQRDPALSLLHRGGQETVAGSSAFSPVGRNVKETKIMVNDIMSIAETAAHMMTGMQGHTRAFVQVQNGCNHRCTFCIIPYGRGNSRSVPMGEIVAQVRALVEAGTKEVVLTGVDISSYGEGLPGEPTLGQLCRRLLAAVPELPRLRISSIDAVEVDDELYRLLAEEKRLMPHLHISLQAGDDMILKRMKRRHLRQDALDFCHKVRKLRPDIVFGADIIAGFPTETDDMFENTLSLVEEAGLTYLHVFPYSEREGTPAAKMPQVDMHVRKERAARLRALGRRQEETLYHASIGQSANVLMETGGIGRSEHFVPVKCADMQAGALASVVMERFDGKCLSGAVYQA